MKKQLLMVVAAAALMAAPMVIAGAEENTETGTFWGSDSIIGAWECVGYEGSWDYVIRPNERLTFLPDLTVTNDGDAEKYEIEDNKITVIVPEGLGLTMTGELLPLEDADFETYPGLQYPNLYCIEKGEDMKLVVTVAYEDDSDPLSPKISETKSTLVKRWNQSNVLKEMLTGKVWTVNGQTLVLSGENSLNLGDGAQTGIFYILSDEAKGLQAYVSFHWDDKASITYFVQSADASSVTLAKVEAPEETITLTLQDSGASEEPAPQELGVEEEPES